MLLRSLRHQNNFSASKLRNQSFPFVDRVAFAFWGDGGVKLMPCVSILYGLTRSREHGHCQEEFSTSVNNWHQVQDFKWQCRNGKFQGSTPSSIHQERSLAVWESLRVTRRKFPHFAWGGNWCSNLLTIQDIDQATQTKFHRIWHLLNPILGYARPSPS